MQSERGAAPAIDAGPRAKQKPVSVVVLLRYRDKAELDRFVDGLRGQRSPHYLTAAQFEARFAPTPAQEARVVQALQRAGFTVTHRYANRTIVDASAPAGVAEAFFHTSIHDFKQRARRAFAAVAPIAIPKSLLGLVAAVNIDSVVHMRVAIDRDAPPALLEGPEPPKEIPNEPAASTGNLVGNPGFESGHLPPWQGCHSGGAIPGKISSVRVHSGKFAALTGTYTTERAEVNGISCVWQKVTIPQSGIVSFWVYRTTNDTDTANAGQFGALYSLAKTATLVDTLFNTLVSRRWVHIKSNLSAYAGETLYLTFGVYGSKNDKRKFVGMWVDDVSLSGVAPSPTPSPTPTPGSSPTPAAGCYSGSTPPPTPPPSYGGNSGWGPGSIADGLLPGSVYCFYGTGQTAAVVIDATPAPSDVSSYLQYFQITRGGTIASELVDGGDPSPSSDSLGEATLDVETIAAMAPGANVIVYEIPALDSQSIVDAYDQVLSDGKASVVNSSFGGCESGGNASGGASSYDAMTDAVAEQGSAEGVTYSASSGDSGVECFVSSSDYAVGVSAPASGPHFVAVGGTQSNSSAVAYSCLVSATPIANPVVWNDCVGSGSGGLSTIWTRPTYQNGLVSQNQRSVPDVSMPAAGIDVVLGGTWQTYWGTSWASPLYVAMQIELDQECGARSWGINDLYGAFAKDPTYKDAFVDVTSGNDDYGGHAGYSAAAGFDNASGIGIPIGVNVAYETCGRGAPARVRAIAPRRAVQR